MEPTDDQRRDFFQRLTEVTGAPELDDAEAEALLDLTREVAHNFERRFAPLTAYVIGRAMPPGVTPEERRARVEAFMDRLGDLGEPRA